MRSRGFTLLELLAVLAVLGILTAIGIPSFAYLASTTKLKGATSDLHLALMKARSEAVKRDTTVVIEPKSGNWTSGWRVCITACPGGLDDPTNVLQNQGALSGNVLFCGTLNAQRNACASPAPTLVTYVGSGRVSTGTTPKFSVAVRARNSTEEIPIKDTRCISVLANGSPFLRDAPCT